MNPELELHAARLILLMQKQAEVQVSSATVIADNRVHYTVVWNGFAGFGWSLCAAVLEVFHRRRRWLATRRRTLQIFMLGDFFPA